MSSNLSAPRNPDPAIDKVRALLSSDPAAAVVAARKLLASTPRNPAMLRLLAAGLRRVGDSENAARTESEAIAASAQNPRFRQIAQLLSAGEIPRATAMLDAIISHDDGDVLALFMLGRQRSIEGRFDDAEPLLRKAMELAPADTSVQVALAKHLDRSRRPALALEQLDRISPEGQGLTMALSLRAELLGKLGRFEEEIGVLTRLLAGDLRNEGYRVRLGHAFRTLGRTDDAVALYRDVLSRQPYDGIAWWSLANLKTAHFSQADIATMEHGLTLEGPPIGNRIRLSFTLGKAFEDGGEHERSFGHYARGNQMRFSVGRHPPEWISDWVDSWYSLFTPEFLSSRAGQGHGAPDPIFIIGIQRSGSTLVEQMLASHPQVEGTAELPDFAIAARWLNAAADAQGVSVAEHLRDVAAGKLEAIGSAYIESTRIHRVQGRPFFTDKTPNNWIYAGLIRMVLPNAKIIDVRRNPLDCCFSNWKQLYAKGSEQTYSMETMGRYYADYVRFMRHVDKVDSSAVHLVIYDDLVDDTELQVRALLDYLGLPFDDACLSPHLNRRAVRTISSEQVRRPVNREGLNQWKPYDQWLGPMKEALGDTLENWR